MRLLLLIGLLVAFSANLLSCAPSPQGSADSKDLPGELPESARLIVELPERAMTSNEARRAVEDMRLAMVDGVSSTTDWIAPTAQGSFEATGHLGGWSDGWSLGDGKSCTLQALEIPEQVGALRIVHAVPLVFGDNTGVTVDGRTTTMEEVQSSGTWDSNWVRVKFSVQDGWIRADALDFTNREFEWGGWPEDYPPTASISEDRLSIDASLLAGPGQRWLSLDGSEITSLGGYIGGGLTTSDPADQGLVGSIDLTVPDRLGPAAIYHVVQVFYDDVNSMPQEADDHDSQERIREIKVAFQRGWLMGQPQ